MKRWDLRPFEIRNLFNPAFCGLVLFRAMGGYEEKNSDGMPFSLCLLVLPLCLHMDSREIIKHNSRAYLLKVAEKNPQLLVGFAERVKNMMPYALEALGLLMQKGCFMVSEDGRLKTVPKTIRKKVTGTTESIDCQKVARIIGKEFACISDRATIYTTFGVRP